MSLGDLADARYGTEQAGLLCGYVFVCGGAGRAVDADEAAAHLAAHVTVPLEGGQPIAGDTFLWLHFNSANQASQRWLLQRVPLPDAFHTLLHHPTSTRVEVADNWLLAVLNDVAVFGLEASNVSSMTLGVTKGLLVSARHTPLRSVDRLRDSVKTGECFRSAVELLAHLLRDQADVLVQIARDVTGQVDQIEDGLMANRIAISRPRLGSLRRMLVRLQRLLAPEPAALFRLLNRPPAWITADDVRELRSAAEELAAALADSAALVERVRLLQEELLAALNERTSKTLYLLTVVTVLALPLTIIPGLFGMNVGGLPMQDASWGFWLVLVLLILTTVLGTVIAFRLSDDR